MKTWLVIAQSAQMLTQAASHIGLNVIAIDCFADVDTQTLAIQTYQVKSLAINDITTVIESLDEHIIECFYGAGFEAFPESLYFLETRFQLLGNSATVFNQLQNKLDFFQRLQQLNITHPRVLFASENNNTSKIQKKAPYLIKPFNSLGGIDIQFIKHNIVYYPLKNTHYYQQYLSGQSLSVLFVANGKHATIIGFNQQWTLPQSFVFAGIINHVNLSVTHQHKVSEWANKLTLSYNLLGLCSLDFIYYKNKCYLLEINPRPPASMQLYQKNLLTIHYQTCQGYACQGQLEPFIYSTNKRYTAYQIIYAINKITIPLNMKWPTYCCNLPQSNVIINQKQPICSIITNGIDSQSLLEDLTDKQNHLFTQINQTT